MTGDEWIWFCSQHPDPKLASCDAPEEQMEDDEEWLQQNSGGADEGPGGDGDSEGEGPAEMLVLDAVEVVGGQGK